MDSETDSSDERNEAIIESVFDKYSTRGQMLRSQFVLVIEKLSKYIPEMRNMKMNQIEATFTLFSTNNGRYSYMTIEQFKKWWSSSEKSKVSKKLIKAYNLYKKYSSLSTVPGEQETMKKSTDYDNRKMSITEFTKMMEDLNVADDDSNVVDDKFDEIDTDGDGVVSFREFCAWLNWF